MSGKTNNRMRVNAYEAMNNVTRNRNASLRGTQAASKARAAFNAYRPTKNLQSTLQNASRHMRNARRTYKKSKNTHKKYNEKYGTSDIVVTGNTAVVRNILPINMNHARSTRKGMNYAYKRAANRYGELVTGLNAIPE